MEHFYRTVADSFPHELDIKQREALAEKKLIREYLDTNEGFFIEIGANDPCLNSQTYHLEQLGWKGILVEPIPELCNKLSKERPGSIVLECACSEPGSPDTAEFQIAEESGKSTLSASFLDKRVKVKSTLTVDIRTVDSILSEHLQGSLSFVSVDVEGAQLEVFKGFTLQDWEPNLILVEDNLLDLDTHRLICSQGYELVKRTVFNNWYIPKHAPRPKTCKKEDAILKWKIRRVPFRKLRYNLRKLIGKGI